MEKIISIDQDISLLADEFTITAPDLTYFLNEKEEFTITQGYNDKDITAIKGLADEWNIRRHYKEFELSVRGRDYLKNAIETWFNKTYFYKKPEVVPKNKYGELIPYSVGIINASAVASQACTLAGLGLIWGCPDYPIVNKIEDTEGFNDTVSNVLKKLIEPLQHTEMFRIDIFIKDDTVYIKKRKYPYAIDETLDLEDIRIKDLTLTKTNVSDPIRNIYVSREEPKTVKKDSDGEAGDEDGDERKDDTDEEKRQDEWIEPPKKEIIITETRDKSDELLTRQIDTTYSINGVVIKETRQVWTRAYRWHPGLVDGLFLSEDTITIFNYAGGGPHSDYNLIESKDTYSIIYKEWTGTGATFVYKYQVKTLFIKHEYSGDDELIMEDTTSHTSEYDQYGYIIIDPQTKLPKDTVEQAIVIYKKITKDWIEVTTAKYINGAYIGKETVMQAGQLSGPKKVGRIKNKKVTPPAEPLEPPTDGIHPAQEEEYEDGTQLWWQKIEVNETGRDLEISDNKLSRGLLQQIAQEIKTEQLARKYELSMKILPIPWLRKGMVLKIDGELTDGVGNSYNLALLSFFILSKRPTKNYKEFVEDVKAIAWL